MMTTEKTENGGPQGSQTERRRTGELVAGAVLLGVLAVVFTGLYLAVVWGLSTEYGSDSPGAAVPFALIPAIFVAGCIRCIVALRGRDKPGLLLLLVLSSLVLAVSALVLGAAGGAKHDAERAVQESVYLDDQRDLLRSLPMNAAPGGGTQTQPTCSGDGICSIELWVKGESVEASFATMTAQMTAAGWTVVEASEPGSATTRVLYRTETAMVAATVSQENDKGGTDVRITVVL